MQKTVFIALMMLFLVLSVVLSPDIALQASLSGISIWWNLVFPGLLPFFILYEIMLAFGLFHGINALLGPIVRRLLRLPQAAGIPILMSLSSGFPTGVEPTMKLLKDGQLTTKQAQRLLSYIHLPNPIFIIVIVGAGLFQLSLYGYIILASVWLAALLLMVLHAQLVSRKDSLAVKKDSQHIEPYFANAMQLGRELDGRSFGRVLGDSVYDSVQKLFIIGGFIIFASVIAAFAHPVFDVIAPQLPFLEQALLEQHIGSFAIADWTMKQSNIALVLALIAACLSFTGISGLLQVSYYTYKQKEIKLLPFISYRLMHAAASFALLLLLWKPFTNVWTATMGSSDRTVFEQPPAQGTALQWSSLWPSSLMLCMALAALVMILQLIWQYSRHRKA